MVARGKYLERSQIFASIWGGGSAPCTPRQKEFSIIFILLTRLAQKYLQIFEKVITNLQFYTNYFYNFLETFSSLCWLRPLTLDYNLYINTLIFPIIIRNLHFFSKFLKVSIFINFNECFWKITSNFRSLPNGKILFWPLKNWSPKLLVDSTEKSCLKYRDTFCRQK